MELLRHKDRKILLLFDSSKRICFSSHAEPWESCEMRLFHHDLSRGAAQFHEIDAARQFDAFLAVDFAGEDGLPKHICDGHLARAFHCERALGWIRIDR